MVVSSTSVSSRIWFSADSVKGSTLFKTIEAGLCIFLVQWRPFKRVFGLFLLAIKAGR